MNLLQISILFTVLSLSHAQLNKTDCSCRLRASSRIVNGEIAQAHQIPWQVLIFGNVIDDQEGTFLCGGVIVSPNYVLTAANCVVGKDDVKVHTGLHRLDSPDSDAGMYRAKTVEIFQNGFSLDEIEQAGDIALLELDKPIKFVSGKVEPGCLDFTERDYDDTELMASGWGTTQPSILITRGNKAEFKIGQESPVLKIAYFHEDKENCVDGEGRQMSFMICIDSDGEDSVCQGDAGGPSSYTSGNGKTSVVGVLSHTIALVNDNQTIVNMCNGAATYARLSYEPYRNWFEKVVADEYCSA